MGIRSSRSCPTFWRYIYSCFIETEIPICAALAVGIANPVLFPGTAPVRKPHVIALIRASDNSGARKGLGRAKTVRDSNAIPLPMVSVIRNRMFDHMQHFAVTRIPSHG